jgi:hypothetical protein
VEIVSGLGALLNNGSTVHYSDHISVYGFGFYLVSGPNITLF